LKNIKEKVYRLITGRKLPSALKDMNFAGGAAEPVA